MTRPKLYPGHQHRWTDSSNPGSDLVYCTVCGFTAPRTLAKLDGVDTDTRCTHQDATGQCLDHQGHAGDHQHPQPAQETRP